MDLAKIKRTIPFNFTARKYQLPVLGAMDLGGKLRGVCVWHRRAGKDKTGLNLMIKKMSRNIGVYYYFLPTYSQARKIIWDGIDKDGFKFIDHFPADLIYKKNEQEMKITMANNSLFQLVGTDNINSIVGTNPIGCIFSEFSLQNPLAWEYVRPILRENGGWALFLYTPRSKNHGYTLYEMAKNNPEWFCERLTVEDTGVITEEQVNKERAEGMDEDLIQQEYYCSFEGSMVGSYYGKQMREAEGGGRLGSVPYDSRVKVNTAWDLGVGDATAIWFFQEVGMDIRLIDYYETSGEGLAHYAQVLNEKGYAYGNHFAPHDIKVREFGTGKSRLEVAQSMGINFKIAPKMSVEAGIDAVRRMFNRCWFDQKKCSQGITALNEYHKEYDENRREYKNHPHHDWSSHGSDAFRMLALAVREGQIGTYDKDPELEKIEREKEERESLDNLNPFSFI